MADATRTFASRTFPVGDKVAFEALVQIGQHQARALTVAGEPVETWKVSRDGKLFGREMDLATMRQLPRVGRALAKACNRALRAA